MSTLPPPSYRFTHSPNLNSDKSVFLSGTEGLETELRRAELLLNNRNDTVSGLVTWHLSVRTDPSRPLNYSHEYILAFHEAQDFQADFWSLKVGAPLLSPPGTPPDKTFRLEGWKWDNPVKTFFQTPLTDDVWHNFGIGLDYNKKYVFFFFLLGFASIECMDTKYRAASSPSSTAQTTTP